MKKIINSRFHGALDYITVIFLAVSLALFHMGGSLKNFTYALGAVHLLLTILTRYELGVVKIIPFKIHGLIELVVAVSLVTSAFIFWHNEENLVGFYYYTWLAVIFLIVFLLTDFRSNETRGN